MADLGQESVISAVFDSDDEDPVSEAKQNLQRAIGFINNWYAAISGADDEKIWRAKIDTVSSKVQTAYNGLRNETLPFTSKTNVNNYNAAGAAFADMFRQLETSIDTIPHPDFLDKVAELAETIIKFPATALAEAGEVVGEGVSNTLTNLTKNLWPWLLAIAVGFGFYIFAKTKGWL